jgi:hypothetical protein
MEIADGVVTETGRRQGTVKRETKNALNIASPPHIRRMMDTTASIWNLEPFLQVDQPALL